MALEPHLQDIERWVSEGIPYGEISTKLRVEKGVTRGSSVANVKKVCLEARIGPGRQHRRSGAEVNEAVAEAVNEVGPTYGRRMMRGYLARKGVSVCESRVGSALRNINQPYHRERVERARNLNPIPYRAEYYGHKIHLDQNEKIGMFGATHVIAVDGFSSRIVGHSTMPVKNNLTIYEDVYRTAVLEEGIWDTVRVDHGTEFNLVVFMQERNEGLRTTRDRPPYLQTQSKQNLRVERMWPEVNNRVNYPLKAAVVELVDQGDVSMDSSVDRFCLSNLLVQVAKIGMQRFVDSWNNHAISGRGVPNHKVAARRNSPVTIQDFPPAEQAALLYDAVNQTTLTRPHLFEVSPLTAPEQEECDLAFSRIVPDLAPLLDSTVNRHYMPFQQSLLQLIELTNRHAH